MKNFNSELKRNVIDLVLTLKFYSICFGLALSAVSCDVLFLARPKNLSSVPRKSSL